MINYYTYDKMKETLQYMWRIRGIWANDNISKENALLKIFDKLEECAITCPVISELPYGMNREEEIKEYNIEYSPTQSEIQEATKKIRERHYAEKADKCN